MVDSSIWDQEIDVPEDVICYVDSNVSASVLPITPWSEMGTRAKRNYLPTAVTKFYQIFHPGAKSRAYPRMERATGHARQKYKLHRRTEARYRSFSRSAHAIFDVMLIARFNGDYQVSQNETGKGMMSGEFASMSALHDTMPDLAPKPIAWGTYASNPNVHFFLCSFHDMTDEVPDIEVFPAKIAELHMKGVSPNGKFGFPVINYQGRLPQDTTWCDTWEECFSRSLKRMLELEEESQGYNEEMRFLSNAIMTKVIPRLLRPLETEGRQILPRLVHGDLWDGNTSTDVATDNPVIFDAAAFYAHNEYELGPWRPTRHKIGKLYVHAYHKYFPISVPEEDFDDRNALYCIVMEEMKDLVEKFPEGYEGWIKQRGVSPEDPKI
ncbi:hypothetical protein FGG08_006363 [Glutinoglossum americanum]|uniref:protein-ribulosamine 3-kinase n=1 Tax=Glutinoglossum americanum TaxID=1670608 RepID=A0A9P8HSS4_9PEZI|nr:hypothetical protein FGG08_006363 [Glutinoglossum americanum]